MSMVDDVTTYIKKYDPEVGAALEQELGRQRRNLELIASENIVTPQVMMAMGTVPTNKYAEGYPGKRYYGGCEYVDVIENLAIERAKKLFGSEHVCVQPHSGASANMAVYQAFLKPGDTVMGLNLDHGGHLTHGSPVNMSGILYHFVPYSINDEGFLDYDEIRRIAKECQPKMIVAGASEEHAKAINKAVFPGTQGGPLEHVIAAKAVCFGEALRPEFKTYQEQILKNAKTLADALMEEGFQLVSGGTDNHLMLVDLQNMGITGKELQRRLDEVYITVNKNAVPNDPASPFVTSGIRIGTPAVTTRGLKEEEMRTIARLIKMAVTDFDTKADEIRGTVNEICGRYPLYE